MNKRIYLIIMLALCYTIGYASITNPELIGTFPTEGNANDVYVRGDYAYVADNQAGLRIVNISNPALPIIEGTCFIPGVNANGVYISGNYAYVTNGGFSIINITNPALPTIEGTYNTPGISQDVYVSGSYAYVADTTGLLIIDITNPALPSLKGTYDNYAHGVYVSGNYAYVTNSMGLRIIAINDPASPSLTGTYDTPGNASGIYVNGNYAYVGDGASGLQIINIINPASPSLIGTYDTSGTAKEVYVNGNYAYVADYDAYLQIIDISNPVSPSLTGTYNNSSYAFGVYVNGNYAYISDHTSLKIIDVELIFPPDVVTNAVSNISLTTADSGGNIMSDGGVSINARGVCWSMSSNPTTANSKTSDGSGTGSFSSSLTGLDSNTTYHVRAYAVNSVGTSYGNDMSFTTGGLKPQITTSIVSSITSISAIGGGIIISDGGVRVVDYGICWGLAMNPVKQANMNNAGQKKAWNFSREMKGLTPNTKYYVRAYAVNSIGTAYGENAVFTTLDFLPEIIITNPADSSVINSTVKVMADTSVAADPVEFYIDDVLLGDGSMSLASNTESNNIKTIFNIDNSEYLLIDDRNQLKKISVDGNIDNVFNTEIGVDDISMNSIGDVFVSLSRDMVLDDNKQYRFIKIDIVNKTVYGIEQPDISDREEPVWVEFSESMGNYSIMSGSDEEYRVIVFLKERPLKVIKNIIFSPYKIASSTVLNFTLPSGKNESSDNNTYIIDWNTLDHTDGIHTIKVSAVDQYSRVFFDEIEVFVRNFKIDLSAIRKEDRAYTFKVHIANLTFKIENPKNLPVVKYVVFKSTAGAEFINIREIDSSDLVDDNYIYYDKNIEKDTSYTYKIIAYDSSGKILSESELKTI